MVEADSPCPQPFPRHGRPPHRCAVLASAMEPSCGRPQPFPNRIRRPSSCPAIASAMEPSDMGPNPDRSGISIGNVLRVNSNAMRRGRSGRLGIGFPNPRRRGRSGIGWAGGSVCSTLIAIVSTRRWPSGGSASGHRRSSCGPTQVAQQVLAALAGWPVRVRNPIRWSGAIVITGVISLVGFSIGARRMMARSTGGVSNPNPRPLRNPIRDPRLHLRRRFRSRTADRKRFARSDELLSTFRRSSVPGRELEPRVEPIREAMARPGREPSLWSILRACLASNREP